MTLLIVPTSRRLQALLLLAVPSSRLKVRYQSGRSQSLGTEIYQKRLFWYWEAIRHSMWMKFSPQKYPLQILGLIRGQVKTQKIFLKAALE